MKEIDLDKYRSAWKSEAGFESAKLTEDQIKKFLQSNTRSIYRLFRVGLTVDIVFKSLLAIAFLWLVILLRDQQHIVAINSILILLSLLSIVYHASTHRKLPGIEDAIADIRSSLKAKIDFYNTRYIRSLFVAALSNSLFFLAGTMFYFHFKYGEVRAFEWDDYLVFGCAILLSFAIGAFAQVKQFNFQIRQLEECLTEIDQETINQHSLRRLKNRRIRNILFAVAALTLGLLLVTYFIFK